MLNAETKRKINNARDILVGKIPVPTGQVEQITLALMYKFMSDMDEQARELGDKTGFFMGEYEKYSWKNITDTSLSAYDRVALYSEGLEKMNNNPHVPQLFRDIFKGAFLPFKDPETLKLFLDQIDEMEYTNSEDLGDAYEYLLSIMGSQGDAGQFRTPRHIIDFIVEVVDPKKEDRVLDPACGTAGFLISAYKHILKQNTSKDSKILGDNLSPMDRRNLTKNFVGYDISPEMRRISLVNMYLHQFSDPQIYEYDTLTSLDYWDEDFDCILANPPFMTPRGGVRPHNRFAIRANRSEILFVDYIMEHLSTTGKAGVIVPEGIIFQSSNAYKNLRKLLVEDNYLWAVVSLPQGVFQPYSGVKTSILFLDKNIAKKTDKILFANVENDGFDLGAQRKEIEKNDLPKVLESLKKYKESVLEEKEIKEEQLFNTNIVQKNKIKKSGDYNLSGNRYQSSEKGIHVKGKWEKVELGELCDIRNGSTPSRTEPDYWEGGNIPWFTIEDIREQGRIITKTKQKITKKALEETSVKLLPESSVLLCCTASVGEFAFANIPLTTNQQFNGLIVKENQKGRILPKFLFWMCSDLKSELERVSGKTSFNFVSVKTLSKIMIPLPPIEEQKKIVEELDRYQRIIGGARMVIDNWKPEIELKEEWRKVKLEEVCYINKETVKIKNEGEYHYIDISSINNENGNFDTGQAIEGKSLPSRARRAVQVGDVLLSTVRPYLKAYALIKELPDNPVASTGFAVLTPREGILSEWLYFILFTDFLQKQMESRMGKGAYPSINAQDVSELVIPLPDIETQSNIVKKIKKQKEALLINEYLVKETETKIADRIKLLFE